MVEVMYLHTSGDVCMIACGMAVCDICTFAHVKECVFLNLLRRMLKVTTITTAIIKALKEHSSNVACRSKPKLRKTSYR